MCGEYLLSTYYEDLFSAQSEKSNDSQRGLDPDGIDHIESLSKKFEYSKDSGEIIPLSYLNSKEKKVLEQMANDLYERVGSVNFKSMYYRAVFSLVNENLKDEDKKILQQDLKFKKMLTQLNNHFQSNYNLLCET